MSAAPIAPRMAFKFMLTVRQGPDKGAIYQLLPPKVTIGRGPENNVTLKDPRASRTAAVIEFSMEKIVITDASTRQALQVNGQVTQKSSIKDGDVLRIGDTELVFIVEAIPLAQGAGGRPRAEVAQYRGAPPQQVPSGFDPSGFDVPGAHPPRSGQARPGRPNPRPSSANSGKMRFYLIIAVVLGVLGWLLTSKSPEKKPEPTVRTPGVIEQEVKTIEDRVEELEKERAFKSDEERTRFEEAQKHYLEGFRDYSKGQWMRAMKSFETARAIDPDHQLALRYYRLSERKRDEMVALLILEGRQYKEKSMYARCSAAFEKVLDSIPNREDVKYKQAEAMKKECDLLVEKRFK